MSPIVVALPWRREDSREEFQKKQRFDEAEEIENRNMVARKQYPSVNCLGGFYRRYIVNLYS